MAPRKGRKERDLTLNPVELPGDSGGEPGSGHSNSRTSLPQAGPSSPVKAFAKYVDALNREMKRLVQGFEESRIQHRQTEQLSQENLDSKVDGILERVPSYEHSHDVAKLAMEKALESTIICLPTIIAGVWQDDAAHFFLYHDVLDVLITFVDRQLVDLSLGMTTIEILLEAQTVQNAERLFVYLETRMDLLTKDMVPGKGKALVILRTLNDLLRRLSKSTHTVFCGRILLFLANIFPLGERSGVNLRGEFNKENFTGFEAEETVDMDPSVEPDAELEELPQPEENDSARSKEDTDVDDSEDIKMVEDRLIPPKEVAKEADVESAELVSANKKLHINVEAPEDGEEVEEQKMDAENPLNTEETQSSQVLDMPTKIAEKKRASNEPEFYTLFWTLQRYFSDPPSLFLTSITLSLPPILTTYAASFPMIPPLSKDGTISSQPTAAGTPNLTILRQSVLASLDIFSEASKKEKALQGATMKEGSSRSSSSSSGDASTGISRDIEEDVRRMFFYPKFLTSKSLLDLEVADSNFRKQVMVQCLILFQYLHSFTEAARMKSASFTSNKSLQLPHRLSEADYKWVTDLEARVYTEISRTPPDGELFIKTVRVVLQGERNWARWKAQSCQLFEKPPLDAEIIEAAQINKKKLESLAPAFPYKAGTSALSRLWLNEPKQMHEFVRPGKEKDQDLQRLFLAVKRQNELIKLRIEELTEEGRAEPVDLAADLQLQSLEERKASLAWRTLRIVSSTQLHLFGKIGVNDIERLMNEMSKPAVVVSAPPPTVAVAVNPNSEDVMDVKDDQPSEQADQAIGSSEALVTPVISPTFGKRPREDSGADIDQEEAKKQKLTG